MVFTMGITPPKFRQKSFCQSVTLLARYVPGVAWRRSGPHSRELTKVKYCFSSWPDSPTGGRDTGTFNPKMAIFGQNGLF